jgi:acyl-lipid omega-6 desaturase (Delta-12 desaturase)
VIRIVTAPERVLDAFASENLAVNTTDIPPSRSWKHDLAPYLEVDRRRSLGQIASVVLPYLSLWVLASIIEPNAWLALGPGLVATVFLVRMYSFFHDLTHNSLFRSRTANSRSEYENASRARRLAYRAYRNPLLMLFVGPSLVFLFERRFPQGGMSRTILFSAVVTNLALAGWAIGWSALVGWQCYLLIQGTTLVAGGAIAAWMLYIQHQYEDTYFRAAGEWNFELAAVQGSSYLKLPRALAWVVGNANYHHVHHLSAKIPNYRLRAAHEQQPIFARTPVVTVRSSIDALRLKLWDEERGCLVRYAARGAAAELVADLS